MMNNTPKLPKAGGAQKATAAIKKFRDQKPSDRLIKIISEYDIENTDKEVVIRKPAIAAKDVEKN